MNPGQRFEVFSDFNCPFCYALHDRLHDMKLLDRCEWRGVQHAPHLSRPMVHWNGALGDELRHEVAIVQRLAHDLPIAVPTGKPNTKVAITQAIALLDQDTARGMAFVREAYRAFWCEGLDLSDPSVLEQLVKQVGGSPEMVGVVDGKRDRLAQDWEGAWHATGQVGVPLIVSPEGELLVGCVPRDHIQRFFA